MSHPTWMIGLTCLVLGTLPTTARSDDLPLDDIEQAMTRGLAIVQRAAENYPNHRSCFSCHHQTMPVLAMSTVERRGFDIDEDLLQKTVEFSADSFEERITNLRKGTGIGGQSMTVGYGLWTFLEVHRERDYLSDAMVSFLLSKQEADGSWRTTSRRPPSEVSHIMCTTLAAYGLQRYASEQRHPEAEDAIERGRQWLQQAEPEDQEDRNARLWGLFLLGSDAEAIEQARDEVLSTQREDGGWAQTDEMDSDAYATGQTLLLLRQTGLPADDPAFRRGVRFLLETQCEDGSWHVETRSRPIQVYFDNGDPHGRSQFISISATSWAVAALAEALVDP